MGTSNIPARTATPSFRRQMSTGVESWLESDRERRSFHFFLTHAGLRLGGYFQTPFWTREVMQAAIYFPSIRHLVVALGSAYEHFEGRQMDPSQMEFALQQSNQSIRHLTQSPSSSLTRDSLESSSTLVTASLLFTILSSMQGHMAEAMDHVRAGLRVLENLEYEHWTSDDGSSTSSSQSHRSASPVSTYPVPIARLRSLLTSLYLQCRVMVNDEDVSGWRKDPLITELDFPTSFASLTDAQDHVESVFGNQLQFFQQTALRYPLTDDEIATAQEHQDTLVYALDCSRSALDAFVGRRPLDGTSAEDEAAIKVLRLYHLYLGIRLGVGILQEDNRELAFDEFEPQFEQMLNLCRGLLDPGNPQPICSSGLGVVIPLHMIGHRCRNAAIRREAVELLLSASRREGLWDSSMIGRIAATTSSLEQDEEMMRQCRVREVKTQFVSDRRARLVFITGDAEVSNQRRYYREMEW